MDCSFMLRIQNIFSNADYSLDKIKEEYYNNYVIKPTNIPTSYFKTIQKEIYNNECDLINPRTEFEEDIKNKYIDILIENQKQSLDVWIDYLFNAKSISNELKIWILDAVTRIAGLNKNDCGYNSRRSNTVTNFVDLDIDILEKCIKSINDFSPNKDSRNFIKSYCEGLINKNNRKIIDGIWIKYSDEILPKPENNNEPSYMKLYKSLEGFHTGWNIASDINNTKSQMCDYKKDFYIFYVKDESGFYNIPKIAIRMNGKIIENISGTEDGQNIEGGYEDIIEKQIEELSDDIHFASVLRDMRLLDRISTKKEEELTLNELKFLYEIDNNISQFGICKDKRINEIRKKFNSVAILNRIFSDYYVIKQNIDLSYLCNADGLELPDIVKGNIDLSNVTTIKKIKMPHTLDGTLILRSLNYAENLVLPSSVKGAINLSSLFNASGIVFPEIILSSIILDNLTSAEGLELPKEIGGSLILKSLKSAVGLQLPETIGYNLDLSALEDAENLHLPRNVGGNINLNSLRDITQVELPDHLNGAIYYNNDFYTLDGIKSIKVIQII